MNRNTAVFEVSFNFFTQLITEGAVADWECVKGVPRGALLMRVFVDREYTTSPKVCLVFEHPDLPLTPEGATLHRAGVEFLKRL